MFDYLLPSPSSVIDDLEQFEVVYAKDQSDYNPLRTLRSTTPDFKVLSRWTLTPEQREAIANGADIYLELMTFGHPLMPISLAIGNDPNPDYFRERYGLPDEED